MAGGLELSAGSGGEKIKTSLSGSFHYQLFKVVWGAPDAFTPVAAATPLPITGLVSITGSLVVSNGGTFAVQVDAALPAGTNAIGKLAANSGVNIGEVDVASLPVNVIDANNSTTTPLGISATFTGTGTDVLLYDGITIQLFADEDGAAAGMRFEFSPDNTNWDMSHQHDYVASSARVFQFSTHARYFRVVFVNGTTGQAAFRVQTVLHRAAQATTIHRLDDNLTPDRSATVIKASIMAQAAGSGDFIPVNATAGGNFKVAVEEFDAPVSLSSSYSVVVQGVAAHDAAVAGNPILTGLEARTTNPTAVADGDAVRAMADDVGRQVVVASGPRDLVVDNNSVSLTLSTTLTFLPTGAAGVFRDLTMITVSNPSSTAALVTIFDGLTGGTARFAWEFAPDGGGIALAFNPPFKQATANNGWAITSSEVGVKFTVQAVENV